MAKILIIEDNFMNLEMARELLLRSGHEIFSAENAADGINQARQKSPDLILMDLSLPEMDGLTATKILKQDPLTKNISVVAFTAMVMQSDKDKAYGAGCTGFISKPINVSTFSSIVNSFIDKRIEQPVVKPVIQEIEYVKEVKNQEQEPVSRYKWHKVLIVDDNPMNAELLKSILEQIGQSSVIAYSGREALEAITKHRFDLILLDIMMPEMSGFELIEHFKSDKRTNEVPVVFISALNETNDIVKGLDLGSYGYITKPYNIEELKAKVLGILRIKDLQDELKAEKNKLGLIFKFSADGIVMLNSNFEVLSCNDRFLNWIGKSEKDVINTNFNAVMNQQIICDDEFELRKEMIVDKGEEKINLEINSSKITSKETDIEGYVLVIRDISAQKDIEKQKETFVAMLTHDLKTPIRAEIMALELLLKGSFGTLNDEQKSMILDTLNSSKYMFKMVDTLLASYKYENGKTLLEKSYFNINSLIQSCYAEIKTLAEDKNQYISFVFDRDNLEIFADEVEIKRVLMNLLSNAINYTQNGGKIIVKTTLNGAEISVSVTDNGKGLTDDEISRLFTKYSTSAKRFKQVGTGLGLYLSKQIVDSHGGSINVESREGMGSTFNFTLPNVPALV